MSSSRIAKERLYRTADDKVVPEGHPDAAFLLANEGEEIPEGYSVSQPKTETASKARPKVEDKLAVKPANKSKS